ncbi:hypothetical protein PF005_g20231 [Phytophthora fragariae]|uniref:Uncharacterized protein n=1 Tax=Phytophthora fragariae TaxID=53985 RepID=A0A6A3WSA9_9STRA|nr:hypothetical protein PF003_g39483 [Phytophthora fragariae]KAE8928622.1 hypothetical protein PF009_g21242 [Phytophthora fragariae]KAE8988497.1 hypothetical protein PF011_g19148 [Phytophthora fragariae]KAE9083103.1 hypothetical protein PF010_g21333 [Phytophthora fragariae]KAE9087694.1 hypothetical protein PF007_g20272 [Phytophthora fragariae]
MGRPGGRRPLASVAKQREAKRKTGDFRGSQRARDVQPVGA